MHRLTQVITAFAVIGLFVVTAEPALSQTYGELNQREIDAGRPPLHKQLPPAPTYGAANARSIESGAGPLYRGSVPGANRQYNTANTRRRNVPYRPPYRTNWNGYTGGRSGIRVYPGGYSGNIFGFSVGNRFRR